MTTKTTKTATKTAKTAKTRERAVLVTTAHRGVFFGYATDTGGETIRLRAARMALYWHPEVRGVLGLAATGPTSQCRVGPAVDLEVRHVTAVASVTPAAVAAWEAAPWHS
jgi:hypothetical protein